MAVADEILDPAFRFILTFITTETREDLKKLVVNNRNVFEHLTYTCSPFDLVVDETKAAAYWTMNAKQVLEWRNIPARNKDVSLEGMTFFRFSSEGQITEARVQNDVIGLLTQLGGVKMVYADNP